MQLKLPFASILSGVFAVSLAGPAFAAPPLEWVLEGDLSRPAYLDGSGTRVVVSLSSPVTRKIVVYGVGAHVDLQTPPTGRRLGAGEKLEFYVTGKRPGWKLAAVDVEKTQVGLEDIHGVPGPQAQLADRRIHDYTFIKFFSGGRWHHEADLKTREFVTELFVKLDESFFVYATVDMKCELGGGVTAPKADEALLLEETQAGGSYPSFKVRRASGDAFKCLGQLEDFLTTTRPERVVMPPAAPYRVHETSNLWQDEEFFPLADRDPRIAKYISRKKAASECFDKAWGKLDPSGTANRYDLVSFDKQGRVKKVEDYGEKIQKKVDAQCKLDALMKERSAIRATIKQRFVKDGEARLKEIAARFAG